MICFEYCKPLVIAVSSQFGCVMLPGTTPRAPTPAASEDPTEVIIVGVFPRLMWGKR